MNNSDKTFLSILVTMCVAVLIFVITNISFPFWLTFWWAILIPFVISKHWLPNSRLGKWMIK
jgi:hypothetical protein